MSRKITPGANYARARKKLGLNHSEMGTLLGIQHSTSIRWESGDRRPPPYIDALMVALYREAMDVATLQSWMDAAGRLIEYDP